MAVSATMGQSGFTPDELTVNATLTLNTDTLTITEIELKITGKVLGVSAEQVEPLAEDASKM